MVKKYNTSCPSGFMELAPGQEQVRQRFLKTIREVFQAYGFLPIDTPLVEREENLVAKGGNPKEVYVLKRLLDEDGDDSHSGNALRFDLTVPLALYVARNFHDLTFPFKRYAIGPVFRGERAQKGRYRQFDQCDIDIIGSERLSLLNDAQVAAVIIELFQKLGIGDFVVRLNNRKILLGLCGDLGIDASSMKGVLDSVDDLEKVGAEGVRKKLGEQGLSGEQIGKILEFTNISGSNSEILDQLSGVDMGEVFAEGVSDLRTTVEALGSMGLDEKYYRVDLSIARGLDYYTGTVYETTLLGYQDLGSICSGGRYDDLAEIFTGRKLPGVGISIGLTRLLSQLFDAEIVKAQQISSTQALVIAAGTDQMSKALEVATDLRSQGVNVENYVEDKKLAKQFDYADKLGIPYCVVIGEDEVARGVVQVKNMSSGEQKEVKEGDLGASVFT